MIGICKLSLLIFISLFISCNELGDYYGKDKYQAYHLINTYVDADSPQIRVQNKEIIIFLEINSPQMCVILQNLQMLLE